MTDGGGALATAAAIIAQTAQFVLKWAGDIILAGILLDTSIDIARKAKDDYESSTDNLIRINECREQMACEIHAHNLGVTIPFQRNAMQTALNIAVPSANYGGLCSFYQNLSIRSLSGARSASDEYSRLFCVKPSVLRRELDYFSGIASVDSSYARARNQERRQELIREIKTDAVLGTHAGTFVSQTPLFGLIEDAASIYAYIQSEAAGSLAGSLALFSYGVTSIGNSFGSR